MEMKIVYPDKGERRYSRKDVIFVMKWPFMALGLASVIVNICTKGTAWSVIAVWSLWMAWSSVFSTSMVEYNRISQAIKIITDSCILLVMINLVFGLDWMAFVVPIVCFGGLIVAGSLFFTDIQRQKQNAMPFLALLVACLLISILGLSLKSNWPFIVLCAVSASLLVSVAIIMGREFPVEFKRRFHSN